MIVVLFAGALLAADPPPGKRYWSEFRPGSVAPTCRDERATAARALQCRWRIDVLRGNR